MDVKNIDLHSFSSNSLCALPASNKHIPTQWIREDRHAEHFHSQTQTSFALFRLSWDSLRSWIYGKIPQKISLFCDWKQSLKYFWAVKILRISKVSHFSNLETQGKSSGKCVDSISFLFWNSSLSNLFQTGMALILSVNGFKTIGGLDRFQWLAHFFVRTCVCTQEPD